MALTGSLCLSSRSCGGDPERGSGGGERRQQRDVACDLATEFYRIGGRGGGVGNFMIPWARSRSGGRLKPAKGGWQGKGGHVVVPSDTRESMGL